MEFIKNIKKCLRLLCGMTALTDDWNVRPTEISEDLWKKLE